MRGENGLSSRFRCPIPHEDLQASIHPKTEARLQLNDVQWSVGGVLKWTQEFFERKGSESSRLDAEILMAHALGIDRTRLYMDHNKPLDEEELAGIRRLVKRRGQGEPVAYIVGSKAFWTIDLDVDARVLIPRPETEHLVERALELLKETPDAKVVDVGCGSGCIALSIAASKADAQVWAVDISDDALAVTKHNAHRLGLESVHIQKSNLLETLEGPFDYVLSNPPYIETDTIQTLMTSVKDYEPHGALDGGNDGLDVYRRLVPQAADVLTPGGYLLMEIGSEQGSALKALLDASGSFEDIEVFVDYAQLPRVVQAKRSDS